MYLVADVVSTIIKLVMSVNNHMRRIRKRENVLDVLIGTGFVKNMMIQCKIISVIVKNVKKFLILY